MARGTSGGGSKGVFALTDWVLGFILGMGLDFAGRAYGHDNSKIFNDPALSTLDVMQIGLSLGGTLITGFGGGKSIKTGIPLGMWYSQLYCKVISPKTGLPRYIIAKDATAVQI